MCERGTDAGGLMRYLYGRGKVDEHTNQHMVAGSEGLLMEWGGVLSPQEASQLGRLVEAPWRHQFADQLAVAGVGGGGVSRANLTGSTADKGGESRHVYHVAMGLSPDDDALTDEQWAQVASDYVSEMGFDEGGPGVGAKWAAVRHGLTVNGGDHVHVVVELVRQDGRLCNTRNDFAAAQRISDSLERRYDFLRVTRDIETGRGATTAGYTPAEARRAQDRVAAGSGPVEPDRVYLQRVVRAAAQASCTEAEFVDAVLELNIDIEPRWAAGGREQVVGYSVQVPAALQASDAGADTQIRYGGKKLAPDLTLPQLRARWAQNETAESKDAALAMWRGEDVPSAAVGDGREHLAQAAAHLSAWNDRLAATDPQDRAAWKRATAHAAGTMSVVATGLGDREGLQLGRAADRFAQVSLTLPEPPAATLGEKPGPPRMLSGLSEPELAARHINLAVRAASSDSARGWMAVMQQMSRTTKAIQDAHVARHEMVAATQTLATAPPALEKLIGRFEVAARIEELPADVREAAAQARARGARVDEQLRRGPTGRRSGTDRPRPGQRTPSRDNDLGI